VEETVGGLVDDRPRVNLYSPEDLLILHQPGILLIRETNPRSIDQQALFADVEVKEATSQ
jgi:hypothetical protein